MLVVPSAATARQRDADLHRRRPQTRSWRGATLTRSLPNHSVGHKIREMDEPVLPASKALVVGFFACHCSYGDPDRLLSRKRRLTRTASDAFSASPRTIMTSFIEQPEHNTAMLESKQFGFIARRLVRSVCWRQRIAQYAKAEGVETSRPWAEEIPSMALKKLTLMKSLYCLVLFTCLTAEYFFQRFDSQRFTPLLISIPDRW